MSINKKLTPITWKNYRGDMIVWALVGCVMATLWPMDAWADGETQATSLGNIICNIRLNIIPFVPLFSALAYICAAVLSINGVLLLKKHAENPNDSQIVKAVAHLITAGALAALPAAAGVIQKTIFKSSAGNGSAGCSPDTSSVAASGLDVMMQNFVGNIYQPMFSTLAVLAFIIGALFIYRGLIKSSKIGTDPRAAATHSIAANFVVGAILMTLGSMLPAMTQSLFGSTDATFSGINWTTITGGSGVDTRNIDLTVTAILKFVQIIGAIAFIRGWLVIKSSVEGTGQATVPQGLAHVIGGTMALNIGTMLKLFDSTFGTGLMN